MKAENIDVILHELLTDVSLYSKLLLLLLL